MLSIGIRKSASLYPSESRSSDRSRICVEFSIMLGRARFKGRFVLLSSSVVEAGTSRRSLSLKGSNTVDECCSCKMQVIPVLSSKKLQGPTLSFASQVENMLALARSVQSSSGTRVEVEGTLIFTAVAHSLNFSSFLAISKQDIALGALGGYVA